MFLRGLFVRHLAGVLLLQTLLAPLQCLAYGAMRDIRMVIQTEDGVRTLVLNHGEDGNPLGNPDQRFSPACCATGTALPPLVPSIVLIIWVAAPPRWDPALDPVIRIGARAPPFEATGPPDFLS